MYDSPYGFERTWNAAVRIVRVDNGWKINEKDESSGYLLFDYQPPDRRRTFPGSFELVRGTDPGDPVRVVVRITQMPQYYEQALVQALARKMQAEYGSPPARRPSPIPDAGANDGSEE